MLALKLTGIGARSPRARRFAAVANPQGVHVVEYRTGRGGLEVLGGTTREAPGPDPSRLLRSLVDAVQSLGARGGALELAVSGFGSAHHILALPAAAPEVLHPVVRRELLRYYPDLKDPVIGFTEGPEVEGSEGPRRELLVGSVPRPLGESLHRGLASHGVRLTHLTVVPQALQAAYTAFDGGGSPAVAVLLLQGGALIGCFEAGALRLYIEPPPDIHGRPVRAGRAVAEQVSRATLFLRQQFPGSGPARVVVAPAEGEAGELEGTLDAAADTSAERLGTLPAGSLAAVGAALDAASDAPLQLLPPALRPRSAAETWTRRIAAAAAAVLVGAALWWAGSAVMVARAEAAAARAAEARVASRVPELTEASRLLDQRRAHAERIAFLDRTVASREHAARLLAGVAAAAPSSVRLEAAHLQREVDGAWRLLLAGISTGSSGATAMQSLDALYRGIPQRLPVRDLELGELESAVDDNGAVAIAFDMSFIVHWERDLRR